MRRASILFFLIMSSTSLLRAQTCLSDSVVTVYYLEEDGGYPISNYLRVDSFDIVTGLCKSCIQTGAGGPLGAMSCSTGPFVRKYQSYNFDRNLLERTRYLGTGSGYDNIDHTEKAYDSISGKILAHRDFNGNGQLWELVSEQIWVYDSIFNLLEFIHRIDTGSGVLQNYRHRTYNYSSGLLQSVIYQADSGSNWKNEIMYAYIYKPNGLKDSVYVMQWNTGLNSWQDSLQMRYDPADGYLANYFTLSYDSLGNLLDSTVLQIDTLNNVLNTFNINYIGEYENQTLKSYVGDNQLLQIRSSHNEYNNGCSQSNNSSFNSYGILTGASFSGHCPHYFGNGYYFTYDSLHRPVKCHNYNETLFNSRGGDSLYYYNVSDSIYVNYLLLDISNFKCHGDTVRPFLIVTGGCSPYQYQWSPSNGLSSDTIATPLITVNDSSTYTITVSDSIGNVTIATLSVESHFKPELSISIVPYSCADDSVQLVAGINTAIFNAGFEWSVNGVVQSIDDTVSLTGLQSGDTIRCLLTSLYFCPTLPPVHETFFIFNPTVQPVISFLNPYLTSTQGLSYQWYYNQQLLPGDTNQNITPLSNGDYTVQVWDSIGCSAISMAYTYLLSASTGVSRSSWDIYPNPAKDHIVLSGLTFGDMIKLTDQAGRAVGNFYKDEHNENLVININFLPQGVYTISISNFSEIIHRKIVIAR